MSEQAPTQYDHYVIVEDDCCNGLACEAGDDSICHARFDCSCEEWHDQGVEDGKPWHLAGSADEKCWGVFDPEFCNYKEWADLCGIDELTHGKVKIPVLVQWDGDSYEFHYRSPAIVVGSGVSDEV